jgi:predicted dehydrogenase
MNTIKWGMIGCGDVTEVKSGPAFNKVNNSALVAVMSRSAERAKDYAERHHVAKWYNDAQQLINDPEVNAVYIATPPGSHEEYTIAALQAGKPVYVEKPMALDAAAAKRMMDAANNSKQKLAVAHYRREQPMFKKIKELLLSKAIGDIRFIDLKFLQQAPTEAELQVPKMGWRVDPAIAGGGLFHDLAPHQLDLILYFFGKVKSSSGIAANQGGNYNADDIVTGNLLFENAIIFSGLWCFNVPKEESMDVCEIVGAEGKISFQVFGDYIINLTRNGSTEKIGFEKLQHVQQPMISKVVEYFLGEAENPCTAEEGVEVMELLDIFTRKD